MRERPYVLLSAAMSADGYIDDASATRLVLSDDTNLDRVDELRSLAPSGVLLAPRFPAIGNEEM
jgi:5-amino-6-(5-phosphoribosylamino)uracil reductase